MDFLLCARGKELNNESLKLLMELNVGLELQGYGLDGVKNKALWNERVKLHSSISKIFSGKLAIHGPFIGMDFSHTDYLLKDAVQDRMDKVFEVVNLIKPKTLVLHTGYTNIISTFNLQDEWIKRVSSFWIKEIKRYEELDIRVVFENLLEPNPDILVALAKEINHKQVKLCLDVGHVNIVSTLSHEAWIMRMGSLLKHVHLHDNAGNIDSHLPIGDGNIDFDKVFTSLSLYCSGVTVSLEIEAENELVLKSLNSVLEQYKK